MNPMMIALVALFCFAAGAVVALTVWWHLTRQTGFLVGVISGALGKLSGSRKHQLEFAAMLDEAFHLHGFCLVDTGGGPIVGDGVIRPDLHDPPPDDEDGAA